MLQLIFVPMNEVRVVHCYARLRRNTHVFTYVGVSTHVGIGAQACRRAGVQACGRKGVRSKRRAPVAAVLSTCFGDAVFVVHVVKESAQHLNTLGLYLTMV
jgi:hypothetical protein